MTEKAPIIIAITLVALLMVQPAFPVGILLLPKYAPNNLEIGSPQIINTSEPVSQSDGNQQHPIVKDPNLAGTTSFQWTSKPNEHGIYWSKRYFGFE